MILITGATGVVGRETVRLLAKGGAEVAAVTRDPHADFPTGTQLVHPAKVPTIDGVEAILLSPRAAGRCSSRSRRSSPTACTRPVPPRLHPLAEGPAALQQLEAGRTRGKLALDPWR
ncbi:NAD-dependent epimerase/dehydratase family protein [Streptomyces bobili]|uniref:NAD-dependent epimerase/dehydratase family protein n=1 Tax=Streptomyces bobili TaxID=67280 RepID=UPI0034476078